MLSHPLFSSSPAAADATTLNFQQEPQHISNSLNEFLIIDKPKHVYKGYSDTPVGTLERKRITSARKESQVLELRSIGLIDFRI